ncbi:glutathione S-transferase family protein [Caulobacter sp. LARHSG274]
MRLIGMLDSPYVRRVAISLKLMDLPFDHEPVSVFRDYDAFAAINPVVKAPTLVTEAGMVLMESGLILDHLERLAPADRRLSPIDLADHARAQRIVGLALAACEKTVQLVYEFRLRPQDKQHQPWIDRVRGQLAEACRLLEAEVAPATPWLFGARPLQADVTAAVAWSFTASVLPDAIAASDHPALADLTRRAEDLPAFLGAAMA